MGFTWEVRTATLFIELFVWTLITSALVGSESEISFPACCAPAPLQPGRDPLGSRGGFLGWIPPSPSPTSRDTPGPAWVPSWDVPSVLAVPDDR